MGNIFSATDIRGKVGEASTREFIWNAGKAFSEWLEDDAPIVVMYTESADQDSVHAFIEGALLQGRDVIDGSVGDQPGLVARLNEAEAAGGALVSSQSTQNLAIVTLFDASGVPLYDNNGLLEIGQLAEAGNFLPAPEKGEFTEK